MNSPVELSVVIPAYNAARYLRATLESVVAQAGVTFDIHVVDDGSLDDTASIAAEFAPRVRCHAIANSGGPSRPRNVGVAASRGDLVAFCDADDVMLPGKLAAAAKLLRDHPRAGLLFTDFQGIDADGRLLRDRWLAEYTTFREDLSPLAGAHRYVLPAARAYSRLLHTNFVGTSSVVCRRQALAEVGPFDETLRNADDFDLWLRLAWAGWDFLFIDEVHHGYRVTGSSVTARGGARIPDIIRTLDKHLQADRTAADLARIRQYLGTLWLEYAYFLRGERQYADARLAYRRSLSFMRSGPGMLGWIRTVIHV